MSPDSRDAVAKPHPHELRYCPMEPGEPVDEEQCSYCQYHPVYPATICAVPRTRRTPRQRGFWDKEPIDL